MKKMTLKDIAKVFDVSISTASKAVNDSSEISEALREKIQEFAKKNNYRPNKTALNLLNKNTKTIAVMVPNILNYFFTQVFCGVEKIANQKGYTIINCITDESYEKEVTTTDLLGSGAIDGLIVSLAGETQLVKKIRHFEDLIYNRIPVVMVDRVSDDVQCDKVIVDDFEAAYNATRYFLNTNCKTIAMVTSIDHSSVGKLRQEGYKKALEDFEVTYDEKLIMRIGKNDDIDLLLTLLLNYKNIDAIMALDEITAVETMKIVKSRGYRVPEDISIIGFTNGTLSKHVTPTLTTISQHGKFIGENAAKILIDRIEQKNTSPEYITKVIKTSLIVRDSTKTL